LEPKKNQFLAGGAQVDITPPLGTIVNGEFVAYYAHHIHDPLYAKALVMTDGITSVALVIVDICAMDKDFLLDVKNDIKRDTGISGENILIASTHTHFAGSILDLLGSPCDLAYRKKLGGEIVKSVKQAVSKMRPAKIGYAAVDVPEHVVCRRYYMKPGYQAYNPVTGGTDTIKTNPAGGEDMIDRRASTIDSELSCIGVMSTEGEWISVLANYSMHYVGDRTNGTISADYFGVFCRHLAANLKAGKDFVGMLSNGTSGEANIWDFLQPDRYPKGPNEKSELIGSDLAHKLAEKLKVVQWKEHPALSVAYEEIPIGLRKPSAEEVEAAKKIVAETDYRLIDPNPEAMSKIYAREQVLLNEFPDTIMFPVQALKIGDITIGGLGGEFFAETGLKLKHQKKDGNYFTITLANGYEGYVPPAHEIEKGGYETWRCRSSHLELGAEDASRNKLMELIREL
jgi:hypothetical protein